MTVDRGDQRRGATRLVRPAPRSRRRGWSSPARSWCSPSPRRGKSARSASGWRSASCSTRSSCGPCSSRRRSCCSASGTGGPRTSTVHTTSAMGLTVTPRGRRSSSHP